MLITLELPAKISTNTIYSGTHWTKRKRIADLFHWALIEHKGKKVKGFPVDVTYIFTFKKQPLDASNCSFMAKMLEDALVANEIIPDDTIKYVSSIRLISQKGDKDEVQIHIG